MVRINGVTVYSLGGGEYLAKHRTYSTQYVQGNVNDKWQREALERIINNGGEA